MNEGNGKGYGCFVMLVSGVAIIFSVAALLQHDDWDCEISPAGFVIATLSALITFVVAWQIWTTIATKEEIRKATNAADKLNILETGLQKQRSLFEARNLEIRHLIDAHAKISEAEKTTDLPDKYIAYAEALDLLLQSNVGVSYEQFDKVIHELQNITSKFPDVDNADDAWNIIVSEREFERCYKHLMAKLKHKSDEIEALRRKLILVKRLREAGISSLKNNDIGKRALQINAEIEEQRKRLQSEYAARQAAEAKNDVKA